VRGDAQKKPRRTFGATILLAEYLAERLGETFDKGHEQGLLRRIPELVKQFGTWHRYA
jgi:hypothetical protein